VLAILSDYNLANPSEVEAARQLLNALSSEIATYDAADFDPSGANGSGLFANDREIGEEDDESVSAMSQQGWKSQTDDTSLSQDLSGLGLEGLDFLDNGAASSREASPEKPFSSEFDNLDEQGKEEALIAIFPALKPFDVKWTLKKCKGNASLAIDELMTQSFLEESGSRRRGIDAFSESELPSREQKSKGKKRRGARADDHTVPTKPASPLQSKWDTGRQDVEFIANRTGMPAQQVSSLYHKNGASIRTTIAAIIEAHASLKMEADDPMTEIKVHELRQDFPTISMSDLAILLQIANPSVSNARELAKALTSRPVASTLPLQLEIQHAPIDLGSDATDTKIKISNGVHDEGAIPAAALASTYFQARETAFMKANAAYRKGKSDPLMGGAAAYYSQVGRDNDVKTRSAQSAAADARVAMQSSHTELDLHGLNVKDALRISREKVTAWWHELGEQRAGAKHIKAEYQIITGKGNHSEGSKGKLGPAVGKMLVREGWKVEVGSGHLIVTGIAKKR
jgi:hypothetical protein